MCLEKTATIYAFPWIFSSVTLKNKDNRNKNKNIKND